MPLLPVSAAHGSGMTDLLGAIGERLPETTEEEAGDEEEEPLTKDSSAKLKRPVRVAIVGRPNVGKSSLLNKILGFERSIVSPIAGTTHDPVDQVQHAREQLSHVFKDYIMASGASSYTD